MTSPPVPPGESWEDFINYPPSGDMTESSSPCARPPSHPTRPNAHHAAFSNPFTQSSTHQLFTPNKTDASPFSLANGSQDRESIPFPYNRMPANASRQYHHSQNRQMSQSSSYPRSDPVTRPPPPKQAVLSTSPSSLPNEYSTGEASMSHPPPRKRRRGRNGRRPSVRELPRISESLPESQSPDWLLVSACLSYLKCNDGEKPSECRMKSLSLLLNRTSLGTLHSIFDLLQTPTSNQTTPHHLALVACEIWRSMHPDEWPGDDQLNYLADLFHEKYDTLESYFRRTHKSVGFEDSGNWTMSNNTMVEETAKLLRGNHNFCVKSGENWDRELEKRRDSMRNSKKKYFCDRCFQAFERKSDYKRHEIDRCMHEVWLCCVDTCRPDKRHYWKRKSDFRKNHISRKHPDAQETDINKCYAKIPGNYRRHCILQSCDVEFRSFEESFEHITNHMESETLDLSQIRDAADDVDVPRNDSTLEKDSSEDESLSDNDSNDSEDGDDGPQPPSAGQSSASAQFQGSHLKIGSDHMQPSDSNPSTSGFANSFYGSSQSSSQVLHVTLSRSFNSIRNSIPSVWSLGEFLRTASPASPKLDTLGYLGYGSNAIIDEVKIHGIPSTMARKTFRRVLNDSERQISREVESMSKLQHPHVVELVAGYQESSSIAIVMRPVADYNLSQYLATCAATSNDRRNISFWFSCLSSGLEYIHEHGVCHFDIKPSNILVRDGNVLFTDFGASTTIAGVKSNKYQPPIFTKLYAAPEMLRGERRAKSDVFSLGCVFLEMETVLLSTDMWQPLRRHQQRAQGSNQCNTLWVISWKEVLYDFARLEDVKHLLDLFDGMFRLIPDERPTATQIKNRINAQTGFACEHYVYKSVQDYVFHVPQRASTWPSDQTSFRQHQAKSNKHLRITSTNDVQVCNDTKLRREASIVAHEGHERLMTKTIDMQSALTPTYTTIRPGVRESKGIDFKSMMMPFLFYQDTHERFRVLGQANGAMKTVWAKFYRDSKGTALHYELEELTSELSTMGMNGDVQGRGARDDGKQSA